MIVAYASAPLDLMLASANRANICSYAVTGAEPQLQPAYAGDLESSSSAGLVCSCCAQSMAVESASSTAHPTLGASSIGPSSFSSNPTYLGMRSFVCSLGQKDAAAWAQMDDITRATSSIRLGARVSLSSKANCEQEIRVWTRELGRLQPHRPSVAPKAPTETLEIKRQLRAVLYKNGVFEKAKGTTVLLPLGDMVSIVDKLLQEATGEI